jgi:6-phosphogluconolactonase (cycloisomerase 2 family)
MISQFTIGSDGTLQAVSPATVAAGTGATGIACDPAGRFVYVTTQGGGVLQFAIGAGGALEPLNPASATGSAPAVSLVVVPLAASAVP